VGKPVGLAKLREAVAIALGEPGAEPVLTPSR